MLRNQKFVKIVMIIVQNVLIFRIVQVVKKHLCYKLINVLINVMKSTINKVKIA
jgi:hypothetical protein